jgi:RNA polymerase sigma factor (sigma-70 family)
MDPNPEEFKAEIERILKSLAEEKGEEIAGMIKPIILTNLERGRIHGFAEGDLHRIGEYIQRVTYLYLNLQPYLHQLQFEKENELWGPLFEKMRSWAYYFLVRKSFTANKATQDIASECATEAAINMLRAYFPYDTDFDPWAHVIVQNTCRKYIHSRMKKSAIPEDSIVDVEDEVLELSDPPVDNRHGSGDEAEENLLKALEKLSNLRRQVIELIYFEELSHKEAAQKMGKSLGAIYSLQFNALQDLRKILNKNGDILNE